VRRGADSASSGDREIVKVRLRLIAAFALPHYDELMSFSETIFLFFLALIIFGPKKLPEMARQAGRLLAELRRASNEFRSQIETEIAHLEVQKNLPPSPAPQGTLASLSVNPAATESVAPNPDPAATLATPPAEASSPSLNPEAAPGSTLPTESIAEPSAANSQASHG
jgi:sec-independent protein translocase protein TatB